MRLGIRLNRTAGALIVIPLSLYWIWWIVTFTGSTGELTPRSRTRILFPIFSHSAFHTKGYMWARRGDTIVLDYDVRLEAGYFNLTVGRTRWPYRHLLRHEQRRSMRSSSAGQMRYMVIEDGRHVIWAGTYSVWSGEARVRWQVVAGDGPAP